MSAQSNIDAQVVEGFGDEWSRFRQDQVDPDEMDRMFQAYFAIFPWRRLPSESQGVDVGCGSGRWGNLVAPRVHLLHAIDASREALEVARQNCRDHSNVKFHHSSVDLLPFEPESLDFAYSLGVLHHVPDTRAAIKSVAKTLKRGAPFLTYLYYNFDNRPLGYRLLWQLSELLRYVVSRSPHSVRYFLSQVLAGAVYFPLARLALIASGFGVDTRNWPLDYYKDKSLYTMRTDALDRFGTRLEQRFSRNEIREMLEEAGFSDIRFSEGPPFWCACAIKK